MMLGKGIIIVVNKWDVIEDKDAKYDKYYDEIRNSLEYASYAPILFISALTGLRTERLFEFINKVNDANKIQIKTSVLNHIIFNSIATNQPPTSKGKKLNIYYVSQVSTKPPTFLFLVNNKSLFHFTYQRYLMNNLRKTFDLTGTPIRFIIREKNKDNKNKN